MRFGLFPSQQQAFQRALDLAREQGAARANRRAFFVAAGAMVVGGVTGFAARPFLSREPHWARRSGSEADRGNATIEVDPRLAGRRHQAQRLAAQADAILRRDHATFLLILDGIGGDETLWVGFERLANMALADSSQPNRQLAQRLLVSCRATTPPARLTATIRALEQQAK